MTEEPALPTPELTMISSDQLILFSPQITPQVLVEATLPPDPNATLDRSVQLDYTSPMSTEDADFPPLPPGPAYREAGTIKS